MTETVSKEVQPTLRFKELKLEPTLQQGIDDLGFEFATPIQALSLPHSL